MCRTPHLEAQTKDRNNQAPISPITTASYYKECPATTPVLLPPGHFRTCISWKAFLLDSAKSVTHLAVEIAGSSRYWPKLSVVWADLYIALLLPAGGAGGRQHMVTIVG